MTGSSSGAATRRHVWFGAGTLVLAALASSAAQAAPEGGASGPSGALAARVDLLEGVLRFRACVASPCTAAGGGSVPVPLDRALRPEASEVTVEPVTLEGGASLLHVRVPARGRPVAWEALVAGPRGREGEATVLWSSLTGLVQGEEGERTGQGLAILPAATLGMSSVVIGDLREDLRICGQASTLLAPRGLDPVTSTFRGASLQRLTREQRAAARPIVAVRRTSPPEPPLVRLLDASGASTSMGRPAALTDLDPTTTWGEARPGAGAGEFVVLRAPPQITLRQLTITPVPPGKLGPNVAAPRAFYVVTDHLTYQVRMPEDAALAPGASYDVVLPDGLRTSCVAVVLDAAYERGSTHPDVALAEVSAFSDLDGPGVNFEKIAHLLGGGGPRAQSAAALLQRGGAPAIDGTWKVFPDLDVAGRMLAVEVASAGTCQEAGPLLVRALGDTTEDVSAKARAALTRCGVRALPVLVDNLGQGTPAVRQELRSALTRVTRSTGADRLAVLLGEPRPPLARLDLLRALTPRLGDVRDEAGKVVDQLGRNADLPTRYLLATPAAELARDGNGAATARFSTLLRRDPAWQVRLRAAEVAGRVPAARGDLLAALTDPAPRVREAALHTVTEERVPAAGLSASSLLERDPWTFVRVAAAGAVGVMPAGGDVERALVAALGDPAPRVRAAAADALGQARAPGAARELEKLLDPKQPVLVRVSAARALGAACATASLDRLTELARAAASPATERDEVEVALAATTALGQSHPSDLARRLAPLRAKDAPAHARRAADRALAAPPTCPR